MGLEERVAVFIDGENLRHTLKHEGIPQYSWPKENFMILLERLYGTREPTGIHYFTSELPDNHSKYDRQNRFLDMLETFPDVDVKLGNLRQHGNHWAEKKVDSMICVDLVCGAYEDAYDHVVLFSGDEDFIPAIDKIHEFGKTVTIVAHQDHVSSHLIDAADEFIMASEYLHDLRPEEKNKGQSPKKSQNKRKH